MEFLILLETFFQSAGYFSYFAVFLVLLVCGFGLPLPEDITLVAGGISVGMNPDLNVHLMVIIAFLGVMAGDGIMFGLGKHFGLRVMQIGFVKKLMTPERYASVQGAFAKHGRWVLFAARFMPGLRTPIYLSAGISGKVSYRNFLCADGLAALISVPVWVYLGYYGASNRVAMMEWIQTGQRGTLVVLATAALILGSVWLVKRRKRRMAAPLTSL